MEREEVQAEIMSNCIIRKICKYKEQYINISNYTKLKDVSLKIK